MKELYEFYWKWWKVPLHPEFVRKLQVAQAAKREAWANILQEDTLDIPIALDTQVFKRYEDAIDNAKKWLHEKTGQGHMLYKLLTFANFNNDEIKNNRITRRRNGWFLDHHTVRKAPILEGTKVSTILKEMMVLDEWRIPQQDREHVLTAYSMLMRDMGNGAVDESVMRISIDPIELLACSLGTSNWTSCYRIDGAFGGGGTCNLFNPQAGIITIHKNEIHDESNRPKKYFRRWVLQQDQQFILYHSFPGEGMNNTMAETLAQHLGDFTHGTLTGRGAGTVNVDSHHGSYQDSLANWIRPNNMDLIKDGWHFGQEVYPCPVCGEDRHVTTNGTHNDNYYYARTPICENCRGKQFTEDDYKAALEGGIEVAPVAVIQEPEVIHVAKN